ncbi:hypothetical protein C4573_06160 [Candidatus Woesearchaeota archaeon]|nr:MAG: hypothetical protein C4573_06160 [Candidatus Woesearchaeota archaeon]
MKKTTIDSVLNLAGRLHAKKEKLRQREETIRRVVQNIQKSREFSDTENTLYLNNMTLIEKQEFYFPYEPRDTAIWHFCNPSLLDEGQRECGSSNLLDALKQAGEPLGKKIVDDHREDYGRLPYVYVNNNSDLAYRLAKRALTKEEYCDYVMGYRPVANVDGKQIYLEA